MPFWGNRLDTHVQIAPGNAYDGTAKFVIVGGVPTDYVDVGTGLTLAGGTLAVNGVPLGAAGRPFAGRVTLHGPTDPLLAGKSYRIWVTELPGGTRQPLVDAFQTVGGLGQTLSWTPGPGGWMTWLGWQQNTTGVLGWFNSSGDKQWKIELELGGTTNAVVDTRTVQLDNTLNGASLDPLNVAGLELYTVGQCEVEGGQGVRAVPRPRRALRQLGSLGARRADGRLPPVPAAVPNPPLATTTQTAGWHDFEIDLSKLPPCGYVVALSVSDRAVSDSAWIGRN